MFFFILGMFIVYAFGIGSTLAFDAALRPDNPWIVIFLINTCLVPLFIAWATAELVHLVRPRRVFMVGSSSHLHRFVVGAIAACVGLVLSLGTIVAQEFAIQRWTVGYQYRPSDILLMSLSTFVAVVGVLLISGKARPGVCVRCRYDLSGLTPATGNKCPECGTAVATVLSASRMELHAGHTS